jgi:hypothetical protein
MHWSHEKYLLIVSLVLIAAADLHATRARGQSIEDINKSNGIDAQYAEKIKGTIQKRMQLIRDDLFAVRQQLLHPQEQVDIFHQPQLLQRELATMKQALQNCEIQVRRVQRHESAKLLCGQLPFLLQIDRFFTWNYALCFRHNKLLYNHELPTNLNYKTRFAVFCRRYYGTRGV